MKKNKLSKIVWGLVLIALWNLIDGVLTAIGLHNEYIEEDNPLMALLWETSPALFISFKLLCSFMALAIARTFYKRKIKGSLILKVCVIFAFLSYFCIMILHIIWISILLFQ